MATQNDTGFMAYQAAAALAAYRAVEISTTKTVNYPNANADVIHGITQHDCASGDWVTIKLVNAPGTFKITAGAAITAAASLYCLGAAAAGKFDDSDPGSGVVTFKALEAATADGDIIEAVPIHP